MGETEMSSEQEKITIDINALYAQMQAIAEEISRLRTIEGQVLAALDSLRRAKDSIDAFVRLKEGRILIPLDPQLNGFAYVSIAESDQFIVSLGLSYYALVDSAKALDILSNKERALTNQLLSLRKMIQDYAAIYERYRQVLEAALAQARGAAGRGG
jgi:prefoldin alpha subunit